VKDAMEVSRSSGSGEDEDKLMDPEALAVVTKFLHYWANLFQSKRLYLLWICGS
jgi:hypothetical protein